VHAMSALIIARATSHSGTCVPSKFMILQRCCHISPNTSALNGSKDFFSCFFVNPTKILQFYLKVLQNTETPKLTKKSENNKTKGLTNAN
jgi:hypothetical protein